MTIKKLFKALGRLKKSLRSSFLTLQQISCPPSSGREAIWQLNTFSCRILYPLEYGTKHAQKLFTTHNKLREYLSSKKEEESTCH